MRLILTATLAVSLPLSAQGQLSDSIASKIERFVQTSVHEESFVIEGDEVQGFDLGPRPIRRGEDRGGYRGEPAAVSFVSSDCPDGSSEAGVGTTSACRKEVRFPSGALTLAAEWFRPPGDGPFPAVVVIRGSGDSHRGNTWTESLAGVLLEEGVGVLIPDKRGSGESDGDWRRADFGDLAEDALSAVRYLSARPNVDTRRIGLMGLSQGGQIVPIAGARSDSVAFLINVVGAAVPFMTNVRYEMLHTFQEEGLSGTALQRAMDMVDTAIGYVQEEVSWEAYGDALRRTRGALGDELTDAYFISDPDHWRWEFFRRMSGFDPADWWLRVDQPALVLLGGDDPNTDSAETARRIREVAERSGNEDVTVRVFDDLGHSLWRMTGPMSEHGLDPEVRRTVETWIHRVVGGA